MYALNRVGPWWVMLLAASSACSAPVGDDGETYDATPGGAAPADSFGAMGGTLVDGAMAGAATSTQTTNDAPPTAGALEPSQTANGAGIGTQGDTSIASPEDTAAPVDDTTTDVVDPTPNETSTDGATDSPPDDARGREDSVGAEPTTLPGEEEATQDEPTSGDPASDGLGIDPSQDSDGESVNPSEGEDPPMEPGGVDDGMGDDPETTAPDLVDPAECTGEPPPAIPSDLQATIDRTWQEMNGELEGSTGARGSRSAVSSRTDLALDMIMRRDGALTYCVRYNSSEPVSLEQRDGVQDALRRGVNAWFSYLVGYDCFPYAEIDVQVVGWAVADRNTLQWDDDGVVDVFVDGGGGNGGPGCNTEYDMDLRLTEGLGFTGFGEAFGQEVDRADYMANLDGLFHIWLHEFGHGFGFPDYYDWDSWGGGLEGPNSVMVAGRAIVVTEWDGWMLRHYYTELKVRRQ